MIIGRVTRSHIDVEVSAQTEESSGQYPIKHPSISAHSFGNNSSENGKSTFLTLVVFSQLYRYIRH